MIHVQVIINLKSVIKHISNESWVHLFLGVKILALWNSDSDILQHIALSVNTIKYSCMLSPKSCKTVNIVDVVSYFWYFTVCVVDIPFCCGQRYHTCRCWGHCFRVGGWGNVAFWWHCNTCECCRRWL